MPNQPTVLLVDDDELIRDLYTEILTDANFAVTVAKDGQEGLDYLIRGGYDVVLLDLIMPEMDGVSVLRELAQSTPARANKHILVLTNLDFQPTLEEAMQYGAEEYLIKSSHTPDEVVRRVQNTLKS